MDVEHAQSAEDTGKKVGIKIPDIKAGRALGFLKDHWGIIAVFFIILLALHVRLLDYHWPYLRNIDSYNFMRDMQMTIDNNGVFPGFDPLMLAPEGLYKGAGTFYPYFGAYSFMLYRAFVPAAQLWQFLIWWPALIASLIAIPAYFLTKKLYDKKAGLIAATLIVFDVSIFARTLGGDPDNDGIVLLLPLILVTCFVYLQDYLSKKGRLEPKGIIFSVMLGAALSVWVWTWGGYWFVIWIMLGFIALKLMVETVHTKNVVKSLTNYKSHLASFFITILAMIIIMMILVDTSFVHGLFSQLTGIFNFGAIKSETGTFPNVYVSVAELQSAGGIKEILQQIGWPAFTTFLAIIYMLFSYYKTKKHLNSLILLVIWFVGPMIATLVAVRFTILFATPMAIGTGILFSKAVRLVTGEDKTVAE